MDWFKRNSFWDRKPKRRILSFRGRELARMEKDARVLLGEIAALGEEARILQDASAGSGAIMFRANCEAAEAALERAFNAIMIGIGSLHHEIEQETTLK